jgi:N-dimethylarginine dimethylaminohydrolase
MVHHPGKELELANADPVAHHFDQPVDIKRFISDHQELVDALKEADVEILLVRELIADNKEVLEQSYKVPNLVFVRDSSIMTNNGAMLLRMGLSSRRAETPVIKAAHKANGVPIALKMKEPESFEGGGFALLEGGTAVAGFCDRSTKGALDQMSDYILENKLSDLWIQLNMPEGIVHIDGEFCELPGKVALIHPEIMESVPTIFRTRKEKWEGSFTEWLREQNWDVLEITDQECLDMAANFLTIDKDLAFHYTGNPRVMQECKERGIDVVQIPGEEMRKGMGGIHCMTCPILRI